MAKKTSFPRPISLKTIQFFRPLRSQIESQIELKDLAKTLKDSSGHIQCDAHGERHWNTCLGVNGLTYGAKKNVGNGVAGILCVMEWRK